MFSVAAVAAALGGVYPPTPLALLDTRVAVTLNGANLGSILEIEDGRPPGEGARDPFIGRPPLPSTRLRAYGSTPTRVVLTCVSSAAGSCSFEHVAPAVRGVGTAVTVEQPSPSTISFILPPSFAPQPSITYHLNASIVGGAVPPSRPNISSICLFIFTIARTPPVPPPAVDVTDVTFYGVAVNSSATNSSAANANAVALRSLFANAAPNTTLYFPPGVYHITPPMVIARDWLKLHLAPGVLLRAAPRANSSIIGDSPPAFDKFDHGFLSLIGARGFHLTAWGATLDANGWGGHSIYTNSSSDIVVEGLTVRRSYEWAVHIMRSARVVMSAMTVFSGADGFDPDGSQDVSILSPFVLSSDDAVAVKATTAGSPTARVLVSNAVLVTKKSALKVGTESLSAFSNVTFDGIEILLADRAIVLYARDGGAISDVTWSNVRVSSWYPWKGETERGRLIDFEVSERSGLSQLNNIVVDTVRAPPLYTSSRLKGTKGAPLQGVSFRNVNVVAGVPRKAGLYLFHCGGNVDDIIANATSDALVVEWGAHKSAWKGLQGGDAAHCIDAPPPVLRTRFLIGSNSVVTS